VVRRGRFATLALAAAAIHLGSVKESGDGGVVQWFSLQCLDDSP